ncbi:MAG: 1-deoxy-D-xylulose-5-phosphate synthase [Flavobacteriales bacterium]|nr:1-deoxy-D-xylulose-5-phosphate synthase [Flavobacteriales bacterium]
MGYKAGELLSKINSPKDLKKLTIDQLPQVCQELREFIVDIVSEKGGHFGASLGVVELTVAIHYVFDTPEDQLVWDVGHQAYGHKILTGRRDVFHTNRVYKGISGFPKRSESEYDTFGVGHSSTSIGGALGMAVASALKNQDKQHIAVIGDGAMTAGQAFEALNHAGFTNSNLLVVLNDNDMSIDPNVGALNRYLTDITTSSTYNTLKDDVWHLLGKLSKLGPNTQKIAQTMEHSVKSLVLEQSNLFESLNFRYFGPTDGHNVKRLVRRLKDLKDISGPKILHIRTEKGHGYKPAMDGNTTTWHAPGVFDKKTGEIVKSNSTTPKPPKYQDVFGHTIIELAKENEKIVGITPAMPTGCSLKFMMDEMPERAFDVGIAEQHAVTFSAGMATQGLVPFCNIYSSFMQRAFDQVVHDVALQKLNVVLCLDRAGLVGADGPTHHGAYDIAFFRCIPHMIISAPMNEEELRNLMYTAQLPDQGTFVIRYPRGTGVMVDWKTPMKEIPIGKSRELRKGDEILILSLGHVGNMVAEVCNEMAEENIELGHIDLRFVKPLDTELLHKAFKEYKKVITIEDGTIMGGMGSAILEFMAENDCLLPLKRLGIPDEFIEHGTQTELYAECNYDAPALKKAVLSMMGKAEMA